MHNNYRQMNQCHNKWHSFEYVQWFFLHLNETSEWLGRRLQSSHCFQNAVINEHVQVQMPFEQTGAQSIILLSILSQAFQSFSSIYLGRKIVHISIYNHFSVAHFRFLLIRWPFMLTIHFDLRTVPATGISNNNLFLNKCPLEQWFLSVALRQETFYLMCNYIFHWKSNGWLHISHNCVCAIVGIYCENKGKSHFSSHFTEHKSVDIFPLVFVCTRLKLDELRVFPSNC